MNKYFKIMRRNHQIIYIVLNQQWLHFQVSKSPTSLGNCCIPSRMIKALQLCVELWVFLNEVLFLRESFVIYSYILVHQIWLKMTIISCFWGYKVSIQQHFKSRLFWKTKCQEAENSRISGDPWWCTEQYGGVEFDKFLLISYEVFGENATACVWRLLKSSCFLEFWTSYHSKSKKW